VSVNVGTITATVPSAARNPTRTSLLLTTGGTSVGSYGSTRCDATANVVAAGAKRYGIPTTAKPCSCDGWPVVTLITTSPASAPPGTCSETSPLPTWSVPPVAPIVACSGSAGGGAPGVQAATRRSRGRVRSSIAEQVAGRAGRARRLDQGMVKATACPVAP